MKILVTNLKPILSLGEDSRKFATNIPHFSLTKNQDSITVNFWDCFRVREMESLKIPAQKILQKLQISVDGHGRTCPDAKTKQDSTSQVSPQVFLGKKSNP